MGLIDIDEVFPAEDDAAAQCALYGQQQQQHKVQLTIHVESLCLTFSRNGKTCLISTVWGTIQTTPQVQKDSLLRNITSSMLTMNSTRVSGDNDANNSEKSEGKDALILINNKAKFYSSNSEDGHMPDLSATDHQRLLHFTVNWRITARACFSKSIVIYTWPQCWHARPAWLRAKYCAILTTSLGNGPSFIMGP